MVMYAGQIVEKATAKELWFDPLHPYSKGLMGSIIVPESGLRGVKLTSIPGVPPNLKKTTVWLPVCRTLQIRRLECEAASVPLRDVGGGRAYRCILSERELRETYAREAYKNEK